MNGKVILLLCVLALVTSGVSGLKCYKAGLHNRRDVTETVELEECDDDEKSCRSYTYQVKNKWMQEMGCSKEDKSDCTKSKLGENDQFECYCKSNYCNAGTKSKASTAMLAAALMAIVWAKMY